MSFRLWESLTESKRGALILLGLLLLLVGGIRLIEFENKPQPMALAAMALHKNPRFFRGTALQTYSIKL